MTSHKVLRYMHAACLFVARQSAVPRPFSRCPRRGVSWPGNTSGTMSNPHFGHQGFRPAGQILAPSLKPGARALSKKLHKNTPSVCATCTSYKPESGCWNDLTCASTSAGRRGLSAAASWQLVVDHWSTLPTRCCRVPSDEWRVFEVHVIVVHELRTQSRSPKCRGDADDHVVHIEAIFCCTIPFSSHQTYWNEFTLLTTAVHMQHLSRLVPTT